MLQLLLAQLLAITTIFMKAGKCVQSTHTHTNIRLVTVLCACFRFVFTFLRASYEKNFYAYRTRKQRGGHDDDDNDGNNREISQCQSSPVKLHMGASPHCHHAPSMAMGRCAATRMYLDKQTGQRATHTHTHT